MSKFMLILQSSPQGGARNLPPDQIPIVLGKFRAWADRLRASGNMLYGEKLAEEGGKILASQKRQLSIVDGPYSETKEVVGGFFLIQAEDYNEAVKFASDCPGLAFGRIAVRQVDPISGSATCVFPAEGVRREEVAVS